MAVVAAATVLWLGVFNELVHVAGEVKLGVVVVSTSVYRLVVAVLDQKELLLHLHLFQDGIRGA